MSIQAVIAIIIGVLITGEGVAIWTLNREVNSAHEKLGAANTQITEDASNLAADKQSLDDEMAAINKWRSTCAIDEQALGTAQQQLATLKVQLSQAVFTIKTAEEKDSALPQCDTLMRSDLAAACPDVARGLRLSTPH